VIIPVVADLPSTFPGLGFQEYAEAIADAVRGGEPPQFTIGLYGRWGSGKSSLLNAIAGNLSKTRDAVIPVMFDAWRYERSEYIIVPILYAIYENIQQHGDKSLSDELKRALRSVLYGLQFKIGYLGIDVSPKDIKKQWDAQGLPALEQAFSKPFSELRRIPKALDGRRIAVLIDDLDRCSPEKVISVLESINLVMDVPGIIFMLALDYDVLVSAIKTKYPHVSGDAFIQKMVQIPFRVPPLSLPQTDFLSELIPNWKAWKSSVPSDFAIYVHDISIIGLETNPRQIKRLINSFLLLQRVVMKRQLSINFELMAALIGVQLRWPPQFRDFQDAVLSDEPEPFKSFLVDQNEPGLGRYAERFFGGKYSNDELRTILQLTAVVANDESFDPTSPASEIRESKRAEFIEELKKKGFTQSALSKRLFYSDRDPSVRFVITKHVARFEKRKKNQPWRLWESYLLTTETGSALKVVDSPEAHFTSRNLTTIE
jgi:hypothetical protein